MKRKFLLLIALVAMICVALVSCAPKPKKIYNMEYKEAHAYDELTEIAVAKGRVLIELKDSIAVFGNSGPVVSMPTVVVNVSTGKTLYEVDSTTGKDYSVSLYEPPMADGAVFLVKSVVNVFGSVAPTYELTLYDGEGDAIASYTGERDLEPTLVNNLVVFNNKAFKIDGNNASLAFERSPLASPIPECDYISDKYNYVINKSNVQVYDDKYEPVASYNAPSSATSFWCNIMNDGNVLIQYTIQQSEDARSYDILLEGKKYKLESLILKVKKDKVKSVNLKHLVFDVENGIVNKEYSSIYTKPDNVAEIYEIEDRCVDFNNPRTVWLKKNGKIKKYLDENITAQKGVLELVADNRLVATNKQGQSFLLNEKGEILGELTGAIKADALREGYIIFDEKIYTYDLKLKLDLNEEGYSLVGNAGSYALLLKQASTGISAKYEYYLYSAKTGLKKLELSAYDTVHEVTDNYFVISSGIGTYKYFNSRGEAITSGGTVYNARQIGDDAMLFSASGSYYRFK